MFRKFKNFYEGIFIVLLLIFSVIFSVFGYEKKVIEGLNLFIASVLPVTLPYLFITFFLSNFKLTKKIADKFSPLSKKLFNVSGISFYAYLIGLLSGYPVGSKTVADTFEQGLINQTESERASLICSTSSPSFIISCVGGIMFNNVKVGVFLFLSHFISSIILGIIFSFYKRKDKPNIQKLDLENKNVNGILYECAYSSSISILVIGSLITVFYVLIEILFDFKILNPFINFFNIFINNENLSKGLVFGILESTRGLKVISSCKLNRISFSLISSVLGFGGLSVIIQSLSFLKKAKIKTAFFIFSKIISAVVNFIISSLIFIIFF